MKKNVAILLSLLFYWTLLPPLAVHSVPVMPDLIVKEKPWIDVRSYMDGQSGRNTLAAWYLDNTTDVTAAIAAALAAVPSTGSEVVFAPGIYNVTPTAGLLFSVKNNTVLRGIGNATIRIKNGAGAWAYMFTNEDTTGFHDIHFEGLTFDANTTGNPLGDNLGTYTRTTIWFYAGNTTNPADYGKNISVKNCTFKDTGSVWEAMLHADNVTISDNRFIDIGKCYNDGNPRWHDHSTIYVEGEGATIIGNKFYGRDNAPWCNQAAIETHGTSTVVGNYVHWYAIGANITGISRFLDTKGTTVTGNVFDEVANGIMLWSKSHTASFPHYSDPAIDNLVLRGLTSLSVTGNSLFIPAQRLYLNAKALYDGSPDWAWVGGKGIHYMGWMLGDGINISNNTIVYEDIHSNPYGYDNTVRQSWGWESGIMGSGESGSETHSWVRNVTISGNTIVRPWTSGIAWWTINTDGLLITGNQIIGPVMVDNATATATYPQFRAGINITPGSGNVFRRVVVSNNQIVDDSTRPRMYYGIATGGDTHAQIYGNTVTVDNAARSPFCKPLVLFNPPSGSIYYDQVVHNMDTTSCGTAWDTAGGAPVFKAGSRLMDTIRGWAIVKADNTATPPNFSGPWFQTGYTVNGQPTVTPYEGTFIFNATASTTDNVIGWRYTPGAWKAIRGTVP